MGAAEAIREERLWRRHADMAKLGGTLQNDILKEYAAQNEYIYPIAPSMRSGTEPRKLLVVA